MQLQLLQLYYLIFIIFDMIMYSIYSFISKLKKNKSLYNNGIYINIKQYIKLKSNPEEMKKKTNEKN